MTMTRRRMLGTAVAILCLSAWIGAVTAEAATPAQGRLPIPSAQVRVFPRVHHLKLTRDPDVYQQINAWCADTRQE